MPKWEWKSTSFCLAALKCGALAILDTASMLVIMIYVLRNTGGPPGTGVGFKGVLGILVN